MPDIGGILNIINFLLQRFFGKNVPQPVMILVNWVLLIIVLLFALRALLAIISNIQEIWTQKFLPLFYNEEQRRRRRRRQLFAKHIEYEIGRIDLAEDWKDEHFAELEAEVEAEGRRKHFSLLPFSSLGMLGNEVRREKSLSKALRTSREQFIIVEGEPGSGKSVALRHVAHQMAIHTKKSHNVNSIIPLYINLKELERAADEAIDRNLIETFVQKSLRRINDRDIDKFLDDEFTEGITNGTWFFLFDSFDEIPEVLSSIEADLIIKSYNDAIADFLQGGVNQCRGVIASRQFRGPKNSPWPRFRIVALSEPRRLELIRRADLPLALEKQFIGLLGVASLEIRSMSGNPLFLSLLCEHVKSEHPFPENAHIVFETYIEHRLQRDSERVKQRFDLDVQWVRFVAEDIAFCMNSDNGLGLSATRAKIRAAMVRQGLNVDAEFNKILDTLEFIKLARSESVNEIGDARLFTFSHRRFQEYFATCVVLRDSTRITAKKLLTDGRWRETAVVMCQTQSIQALSPLIHYAEKLLMHFCQKVSNLIDDPLEYISNKKKDGNAKGSKHIESFPWPDTALNMLSILQEGFYSRLQDLPNDMRTYAGKLVLSATETGMLDDRKWALEVCGVAPEAILIYMLKSAFTEGSQWLKEVAYRQVVRISEIPIEIIQGMRNSLLNLALENRLYRERYTTRAHLARLPKTISIQLLSSIDLLLWFPLIDLQWHVFAFLSTIIYMFFFYPENLNFYAWILFLFIMSYLVIFAFKLKIKGSTSAGLITLSRLLLYEVLVILLIISSHDNKYWTFLTGLITLYINIVLILYSVYISVKENWLSKWYFIAFVPFWIFIMIIGFLCQKLFLDIKSIILDKNWKRLVIRYIIPLFICILCYNSIYLLWENGNSEENASYVFGMSFFVLLIILSIAIIIIGIDYFYQKIKWMKWIKKSQKVIDCQECITYNEFYTIISSFRWSGFHLAFARNVRKRQLLLTSRETEKSLKKLALEMEMALRLKKQRENHSRPGDADWWAENLSPFLYNFLSQSPLSPIRSLLFKDNNITAQLSVLANASECKSLVLYVNDDILDVIHLLLEDAKFSLL